MAARDSERTSHVSESPTLEMDVATDKHCVCCCKVSLLSKAQYTPPTPTRRRRDSRLRRRCVLGIRYTTRGVRNARFTDAVTYAVVSKFQKRIDSDLLLLRLELDQCDKTNMKCR